eukprot:Nk52_evm9s292 gene=Nk52_evmTU9s292
MGNSPSAIRRRKSGSLFLSILSSSDANQESVHLTVEQIQTQTPLTRGEDEELLMKYLDGRSSGKGFVIDRKGRLGGEGFYIGEYTPKGIANQQAMAAFKRAVEFTLRFEESYFDFNDSFLCTVPNEIALLKNVEQIDMSKNAIYRVPREMEHLTNLTVLNLSENLLHAVPNELVLLPNLADLSLANNQITAIPEYISEISTLKILDMSYNKLRNLPLSMKHLDRMERLILKGNQFRTLPVQLGSFIASLQRLDLDQNIQLVTPLYAQDYIRYLRSHGTVWERLARAPTLKDLAAKSVLYSLFCAYSGNGDLMTRAVKCLITLGIVPLDMYYYLKDIKYCSDCGKPFIRSGNNQLHFDLMSHERPIPLVHEMCSPHWCTEQGRIAYMFQASPHRQLQIHRRSEKSTGKSPAVDSFFTKPLVYKLFEALNVNTPERDTEKIAERIETVLRAVFEPNFMDCHTLAEIIVNSKICGSDIKISSVQNDASKFRKWQAQANLHSNAVDYSQIGKRLAESRMTSLRQWACLNDEEWEIHMGLSPSQNRTLLKHFIYFLLQKK